MTDDMNRDEIEDFISSAPHVRDLKIMKKLVKIQQMLEETLK